MNTICFKCQKTIEIENPKQVYRSDECPSCFQALHCCKMCVFYDVSRYNECKESVAMRVPDKEKANFCEFYRLSEGQAGNSAADDALRAAKSLFKD